MKHHLIEKKPTWWLLYTNGAALVGLVGLLEVSVASDAARLMLEIVAVVGVFVLMLCWLRVNRGRIELVETPVMRRTVFELTGQNGAVVKQTTRIAVSGCSSGKAAQSARRAGKRRTHRPPPDGCAELPPHIRARS